MRYLVIILLFSVQSAFGQAVKLYLDETQIRTNFTFIDPASTEEAGSFLIDSDGTGNVTWGRGIDTVKVRGDSLVVIIGNFKDSIVTALPITTASNGLNLSGSDVQLGGTDVAFGTSVETSGGIGLGWQNNWLGFGLTYAAWKLGLGQFDYLSGYFWLPTGDKGMGEVAVHLASDVLNYSITDSVKIKLYEGNTTGTVARVLTVDENIQLLNKTVSDQSAVTLADSSLIINAAYINSGNIDSNFVFATSGTIDYGVSAFDDIGGSYATLFTFDNNIQKDISTFYTDRGQIFMDNWYNITDADNYNFSKISIDSINGIRLSANTPVVASVVGSPHSQIIIDSIISFECVDSIYTLNPPPPNYTNDAAADADSNLPSGALYTIDADTRAIRIKP